MWQDHLVTVRDVQWRLNGDEVWGSVSTGP